jgi:Sec-independent protein translocase protein TatA
MKSLVRHLYIACSSNPYGLGVIGTVAFAALIFGMLKLRQVARAIGRHCAAYF